MASAASKFPAGARFRVIREGAYLTGMRPFGPGSFQGWRRTLDVGDVIESLGFGPGWGSDPGYGIHWTSPEVKEENVSYAEFKPNGSGNWFTYYPPEGWLEKVT